MTNKTGLMDRIAYELGIDTNLLSQSPNLNYIQMSFGDNPDMKVTTRYGSLYFSLNGVLYERRVSIHTWVGDICGIPDTCHALMLLPTTRLCAFQTKPGADIYFDRFPGQFINLDEPLQLLTPSFVPFLVEVVSA